MAFPTDGSDRLLHGRRRHDHRPQGPALPDLADGVDGGRVPAVDVGGALLLRADLDGDGALDAPLAGGAGLGLGLDGLLANAIA